MFCADFGMKNHKIPLALPPNLTSDKYKNETLDH